MSDKEPRAARRMRRLMRQRPASAPSEQEIKRTAAHFQVGVALMCVAMAGLWSGSTVEKGLYAASHYVEPASSTQPHLLPAPILIVTPTPSR